MVEFQLERTRVLASLSVRTVVAIVEQEDIAILQLGGRVLLVEAVCRVWKREFAPGPAETPLNLLKVRRYRNDLVEMA